MGAGNTRFVYSVDSNFFIYTSATNPFDFDIEAIRAYPHMRTINETIHGTPSGAPSMSFDVSVVLHDGIPSNTPEASADGLQSRFGGTCSDLLHDAPGLRRFSRYAMDAWSVLGLGPAVEMESSCSTTAAAC